MGAERERIRVVRADITTLELDAIVNAANEELRGGSGVDGAIHAAAGPALASECRKVGGCPTGEARLTGAYNLPAKYVVHTVGPVWRGGEDGEDERLASCYRACLGIVRDERLESVAFPAISTGVYGFPKERAARVAVRTVEEWVRKWEWKGEVVFCCFSEADAEVYRGVLGG